MDSLEQLRTLASLGDGDLPTSALLAFMLAAESHPTKTVDQVVDGLVLDEGIKATLKSKLSKDKD